jgi:hypothetical protein
MEFGQAHCKYLLKWNLNKFILYFLSFILFTMDFRIYINFWNLNSEKKIGNEGTVTGRNQPTTWPHWSGPAAKSPGWLMPVVQWVHPLLVWSPRPEQARLTRVCQRLPDG